LITTRVKHKGICCPPQ